MKKIYLLALSVLTMLNVGAQDLANKIPASAAAVVSVKAKNLTDLLSTKEFNQSYLGKKILKEFSKDTELKLTDIEQLGIDLSATLYYFHQSTDSIGYNCFLVPLKNLASFEKLFSADKKAIIKNEGSYRKLTGGDSSAVLLWNNEMLLVVNGEAKRGFFNDSTISKRYNIFKSDGYSAYDSTTVSVDTAAIAVESIPKEETVIKSTPKGKKSPKGKKAIKKSKKGKKVTKNVSQDDVIIDAPSDLAIQDIPQTEETITTDTTSSYSSYYGDYDKMKTLAYGWTEKYARQLANDAGTNSILTNASYLKSLDENAEVTMWISSFPNLYQEFHQGILSPFSKTNYLAGYGSMSAKLYMEQDRIFFTGGIEMDDEQAEIYNRVTNRKLNKKFLKYVNDDKLVGYLAYAIDTKAYLEEYPKMLKKMFGNMDKMGDEISLGIDFFSLLLDEQAVANVLPGDALFLLNGVLQKEYTYTGYEYDEEYNSKEVQKKGVRTIPDFLLMISTNDPSFLEKLIAYGVKKHAVTQSGDYYKIALPDSIMTCYFMIKEGMIFLGTSESDMMKIAQNTFEAKISKEHKKLMTKYNFASFFSAKRLSSSLVLTDEEDSGWVKKLTKVLNKTGDIAMRSYKIQDNTASFEVSMGVPNGYANSLQYIFSLIEDSSK